MVVKKWPLIMLAAALLTGCVGPAKESAPPDAGVEESGVSDSPGARGEAAAEPSQDGRQYEISFNNGTSKLVFDARGNEIPPEKQFTVLYDIVSGQPQCQKRTVVEDSGMDDEYGMPVLRRTTALYDLEGKLLHDFAEKDYEAGFGDFIIRHDHQGFVVSVDDLPKDYHSGLWNYKTGETVLDDVAYIRAMNEEKTRFLMTDAFMDGLGVTDARGNVIGGFPPPEGCHRAEPWHGMVITNDMPYDGEEGRDTLRTETLETVLSCDSLNGAFRGIRGKYMGYRDGEEAGILDGDFNKVYSPPDGETVRYFDGELVILSKVAFEDADGARHFSYRLVKTDGTELASDFENLVSADREEDAASANRFLAYAGGELVQLGRDGARLASQTLPGAEGIFVLGGGLITCRMDDDTECLLNENLEIVIAPGTYRSIYRLTDWAQQKYEDYDLLECTYYLGGKDPQFSSGAVMRRDVLDLTGRRIVTGLTDIGGVGPNRMAVQRGFSVGLMDWEGNWIVKESIFREVNDDYNPWGFIY